MKCNFPFYHLEKQLLNTINSIAMFPVSQTAYQLVGSKPEWLNLLGRCSVGQQLILDQPEGFLENFLIDAKQFWSNNTKGTLRSEKWLQTDAQGINHPFEAVATLLDNHPVLLVQLITESDLEIECILQSIQDNALKQEHVEHRAYKDDLTELYNRRGFLLHAEKHLLVARCKQQATTIACINIDRLKSINDQYGHSAGNRVIARAASLFKKVFRENDLLARISGDEFLALMSNIDSTKIISLKVRLDRAINDWNAQNQPDLHLCVSIGLASDNAEQPPLEQLISQANANMSSNQQSKYQSLIAS